MQVLLWSEALLNCAQFPEIAALQGRALASSLPETKNVWGEPLAEVKLRVPNLLPDWLLATAILKHV